MPQACAQALPADRSEASQRQQRHEREVEAQQQRAADQDANRVRALMRSMPGGCLRLTSNNICVDGLAYLLRWARNCWAHCFPPCGHTDIPWLLGWERASPARTEGELTDELVALAARRVRLQRSAPHLLH